MITWGIVMAMSALLTESALLVAPFSPGYGGFFPARAKLQNKSVLNKYSSP
jgi:hypothetical protein